MTVGSSKIASYFASSQGNSGKPKLKDEVELQKAIELSEAEARLSNLSEGELLQQALEASRAEMVKLESIKRKRSSSLETDFEIAETKSKKIQVLQENEATSSRDVIQQPVFTAESFKEESFGDKEEIINRLNGSLDLLYCKSWIRREERLQLREWMLNELSWHRVRYIDLLLSKVMLTNDSLS